MSITFYYAPHSSAVPVASALSELGVAHERVTLDLTAKPQRRPEFLAINPNGKVPTLVVDGTPMFEAVAIMQWLGDRYGVDRGMWPAFDDPRRLTALSWSTWAYVTLGSCIQRYLLSSSPQSPDALHHPPLADFTRSQLDELFDILEARLAAQPHLLGDAFSLADLIVGSVCIWASFCGILQPGRPKLDAWLERVKARPSVAEQWR